MREHCLRTIIVRRWGGQPPERAERRCSEKVQGTNESYVPSRRGYNSGHYIVCRLDDARLERSGIPRKQVGVYTIVQSMSSQGHRS